MANIIGQSRYCLRLLPHLVPAISSSSRLFSRQLLRQNIRTPGICPVTLPTCACSYSARTPLSANPSAIEDLKMENEEALQTLEAKPEEEEEPRRRRRRSRRSRKKRLITPIQEVGHEFNAEVVPELVSDKRPYVNIDLDHLRQLLFTVNAIDVCVVRVDRQKMHVDYMISCVGKSSRHLESMGTAIAGEVSLLFCITSLTLYRPCQYGRPVTKL